MSRSVVLYLVSFVFLPAVFIFLFQPVPVKIASASYTCSPTLMSTPAPPTPTGSLAQKIVTQTNSEPFEYEAYTYSNEPAIYTRDATIWWSMDLCWGMSGSDDCSDDCVSYIENNNTWEITIYRSTDADDVYYTKTGIPPQARHWDMAIPGHEDPNNPDKLNQNIRYTLKLCAYNPSGGQRCRWEPFYKRPYNPGSVSGRFYDYDVQGSPKCAPNQGVLKWPTSVTAYTPSGWHLAGSGTNSASCTLSYSEGLAMDYVCPIQIDNNNYDMYSSSYEPEDIPVITIKPQLVASQNGLCPASSGDTYSCAESQSVSLCNYSTPAGVGGLDLHPSGGTDDTSRFQNIYLEQTGGWFKLKNATYHARSVISSSIPRSPQQFAEDDPDDDTMPYLISGNIESPPEGKRGVGVVTSPSETGINLGYAQTDTTYKNWKNTSYEIGEDSFEEIKDRIVSIGAIKITTFDTDPFSSQQRGAYYYKGNVTVGTGAGNLNPLWLTGIETKFIALVVDGNVTGTVDIAPSNGYFMLVAKNITLNPGVENLNGIYAADSIDLGGGENELKIRGNLTTLISSLSGRRNRTNSFQPSMFVVFDPVYYIKLLPQVAFQTRRWSMKQ